MEMFCYSEPVFNRKILPTMQCVCKWIKDANSTEYEWVENGRNLNYKHGLDILDTCISGWFAAWFGCGGFWGATFWRQKMLHDVAIIKHSKCSGLYLWTNCLLIWLISAFPLFDDDIDFICSVVLCKGHVLLQGLVVDTENTGSVQT